MTEPVSVLGLGAMGFAIASAFTSAGSPTTTWNRSARPAPEGTVRVDDVTAAVTASKTVVVCLTDYDAVRSVLMPLANPLRGRLLVNLTSGSPDSAREMAEWATTHDISYTDGAIMTPTDTIGTAAAVILHSGHQTDALAPLGGNRPYLGAEPGRASAFDVALLDVFWTAVTGLAHGFALARSENIAATELAPFARGISDLMSIMVDEYSSRLTEGRHPGDEANLRTAAAGMAHIIETTEARGLDASVMKAAHALTRRAVDTGHGADGISYLTVALEQDVPERETRGGPDARIARGWLGR